MNGYTWKEWQSLSRLERIYDVAFYEMHELIAMHRNEAETEHMKRMQAANR